MSAIREAKATLEGFVQQFGEGLKDSLNDHNENLVGRLQDLSTTLSKLPTSLPDVRGPLR